MKRVITLFALLGVLTLSGCPRSAEDLKKDFARNTTATKGLVALYPGFKAPLEAKLAAATKAFEEGKAISDPDASKTKLGEANAMLTRGFVGTLKSIDGQIKSLRKKGPMVQSAAADKADRASADTAVKNAEKAIKAAEERLKAGAKDEAGAKAVVDKVASDLTAAEDTLKQLEKAFAAKKKAKSDVQAKKDAATKKAQDAQTKAAEKEAKAKAPWTCEYCGGTNKPELVKCAGCGAARPS